MTNKWIRKMVAVTTTLLATEAFSKPLVPSEVLQKPLILGASVSAGYGNVPSPGKNLALRYTSSSKIRTEAANGRSGRDTLKQLSPKDFQDRSIVIAMDLFFWDSARAYPNESLAALKKLMTQVSEKKIPLVIGEIPALLPSHQPNLAKLNREILRACAETPNCRVLPLNAMLTKILTDGYIVHNGQRYGLEEITPDGLHLSPVGSEYLADRILEIIEKT